MIEGTLHYLMLACHVTSTRQMVDICDDITSALQTPEEGIAPAEVLVISYGLTTKRRHGFILLLVKGPIPARFTQELQSDASIMDFVYASSVGEPGAPGIFTQDQPEQNEQEPPARPNGYCLLTKPSSLFRPDNERWIAQAESDDPGEGMGILIYEERRKILFLTAEESISTASCLLRVAPALLAASSERYLLLHPTEVEAVSTVLWDTEQRRALRMLQSTAKVPAPVSLQDLNVWLAYHHYRLVPNDDLPGFRVVSDDAPGGEA